MFGAPRVYVGGPPPEIPPTDHVCGTAEDFAQGGVYDTSLPPVVYLPNGLPECCYPTPGGVEVGGAAVVIDPRGGVAISGTAYVPPPSNTGGVVVGGEAIIPTTADGVVIGGELPPLVTCDNYRVEAFEGGDDVFTRTEPGVERWESSFHPGWFLTNTPNLDGYPYWTLFKPGFIPCVWNANYWTGQGRRDFFLAFGFCASFVAVSCAD